MSTKKRRSVCQLDVRLRGIEPPIWRRIQVWEDTKLPQLHRIFQMLFLWEDCHLHEFVVGRSVYTVPDPEDDSNRRRHIDERGVPLNRIAERAGDTFTYVYDFGDNWWHDVLLEAMLLPEPDTFYPRCVAGARSGPPEDVGGVSGYAHYLEALANPGHDQHESLLGWRGPFDPEEFSRARINAALKRAFFRRPAVPRTTRSRGA